MAARTKTTSNAEANAGANTSPAANAADAASAKPAGKAADKSGRGRDANGVITIKKYANRRLYNTATSSYVTLDHLCQMVKDDVDFVVYDAKTGDDITRAVLTQIIVEEESKGQNLLPISFLRQLIGFYGDNLQMVVPRYLESAMGAFAENQGRMRSYMNDAFGMKEAFGGMFPFPPLEDMTKRNVAMFENAMRMFNPMAAAGAAAKSPDASKDTGDESQGETAGGEAADVDVQALKAHLDMLQHQLDILGGMAAAQKTAPDASASEDKTSQKPGEKPGAKKDKG
jgi:polyhydroxyalkanoate synthesis repressor PhaR